MFYKFATWRPPLAAQGSGGGNIRISSGLRTIKDCITFTVVTAGGERTSISSAVYGGKYMDAALRGQLDDLLYGNSMDLYFVWRGCITFSYEGSGEQKAALCRILFPPGDDPPPAFAARSGPCWLCGEATCILKTGTAEPSQPALVSFSKPALTELAKASLQHWLKIQKTFPTFQAQPGEPLRLSLHDLVPDYANPPPLAVQVCPQGHLAARCSYSIYDPNGDEEGYEDYEGYEEYLDEEEYGHHF